MLFLDRVEFDVIYNGKRYELDCKVDTKISEVCKKLGHECSEIYSLFNERYYSASLRIRETDISDGDIILI